MVLFDCLVVARLPAKWPKKDLLTPFQIRVKDSSPMELTESKGRCYLHILFSPCTSFNVCTFSDVYF